MTDRRQHERNDILLDAEISSNDLECTIMQVRDMGMGGVFLMGDSIPLLAVNDEVDLTIYINMEREGQHTIRSKVTRISDDGLALKFLNVDIGYLAFLEKILNYKLGGKKVA